MFIIYLCYVHKYIKKIKNRYLKFNRILKNYIFKKYAKYIYYYYIFIFKIIYSFKKLTYYNELF